MDGERVDVRIVGWDAAVGDILGFAFMAGIAFGVVVVVLITAATLTLLTRRGS